MEVNLNSLNLLVIPTDYCNMRCKYCFFDKEPRFDNRMSDDILNHLMEITIPYYEKVNFVWHGGEPLSMGLDFFKKVVELQNRYKKSLNVKISNSIQSNFTLLTQEMIDYFHDNSFTISTSFDGINNELTRGCSKKIMNAIENCYDSGYRCGTIMIASNLNINTFIESYHFFKQRNMGFKINPYLGTNSELKLNFIVFAEKLIELFDYWAFDEDTNINITSFIEVVEYVLNGKKFFCTHTSCLGRWASVYYDGTIKPCNRYFPDEYSYGNINEYEKFGDAFNSNGFRKIITKAIERREKCKNCEIFDFCCGGCNYVALTENGGIENNAGDYCKYLVCFVLHVKEFLENADISKLNKYLKKCFSN